MMALARWCQFWKFVQPNWPLLSLLPSFSRHLCKTSFLQLFTIRCPFMNRETLTKSMSYHETISIKKFLFNILSFGGENRLDQYLGYVEPFLPKSISLRQLNSKNTPPSVFAIKSTSHQDNVGFHPPIFLFMTFFES